MAVDTPTDFRNLVIYQVYVRNHSPEGTFAEVEADLQRIRSMGVDVVYFMPIHPIGQVKKKGRLGCPYSIRDYRDVNPAYGTMSDFIKLVNRIHALGMKVMIDVVFNHTAHDSFLVKEHPDWFHQDETGRPVTTVSDWSDVIDLKQPNPALTRYLIDTLIYWVELGVDGFRCDVASLLPISFWEQAREEVAIVKPGVIWMAESVHANFVIERRARGLDTLSDGELYRAFDILYDYDIWPVWRQAVRGQLPVECYIDLLRFQDGIYPQNYLKIRCVENHDQPRIMDFTPSRESALAWTAFAAFNKGPFFFYAGQEAAAVHRPTLFDTDTIIFGEYELQYFITQLASLKKHPAQRKGRLVFLTIEPALQACWYAGRQSLYGIFNLSTVSGDAAVQIEDGDYRDLVAGGYLRVQNGVISIPGDAVILEAPMMKTPSAYPSKLMNG